MKRYLKILLLFVLMVGSLREASAQGGFNRLRNMGGNFSGGGNGDSLLKRVDDSITISFRYFDSTRMQKFDTVLGDFNRFYPVPWQHKTLGNLGNPTENMLFSPRMQSGWDHGFHSLDVFTLKPEEIRFYNTTNPFSELGYLLGSRLEQMIHLLHTQNIRPNWNASFQYRLVSAPGFFQNQATNHNSYRFGSWYQSKNKRYQNFFVIVGNKLQSSENGGIRNESDLNSETANERQTIATRLGGDATVNTNPFLPSMNVATRYSTGNFILRQQYDLGQKDSIVTDTSVIPLFYPRLRFEHTITYNAYNMRFADTRADSAYYFDYYDNSGVRNGRTNFLLQDEWSELLNDLSVYSYPDSKNSQQFLKLGASVQNLRGQFTRMLDTSGSRETGSSKASNVFLHGEYRNKTRNQKWDMQLYGKFYVQGFNAGDFNIYASLKRMLSKKLGYFEAGFQNVNRTPSFNFTERSSFYLANANNPVQSFNKENITNIFASLDVPRAKLRLSGSYYLMTNYLYFTDQYKASQASSLFNILAISAYKQIRIGGNWNWKTWIVLQQKAGNAPVNLPLVHTRNQVGYDGNLGFKKLNTSFGLEFRYFTPYKANNYSPLIGQFSYQDSNTVSMKLPEITAYVHLRIRTFTAYVRAENLNSFSLSRGGFLNNNILIPNYPSPGLQIRFGILWSFIN